MSQEQTSQEQNLMFKSDGKPYGNEQAAKSAISKMDLDTDRYVAVEVEGGFAIAETAPKKPEVKGERFFRVEFQAKTNTNDPDDVTLSVNGETLLLQREAEIVIPERFLECAKNAWRPVYKRNNGERKESGKVLTFPYSVLGEATESEYLEMKKKGNAK